MGLIAQAYVEILPDTAQFAAQLTAQLKSQIAAAKVPPVQVPVVAGAANVGGATAAAARASGAAAASATATASAANAATVAQRQWKAAIDAQTVSQEKLNAIEAAAVGTTTAYEAARHRLTAANIAVKAAEDALTLSQKTGIATTIARAEAALAEATAQQNLEIQTIETLRAQQAQSRQLGQLVKGGAASALTFAGLRGATLAASGAFLAGTAAVVAFGRAIGAAASLESQLSLFAETSGATADQMEQVSEQARALGADITLPAVSAGDAAQAMLELSKAGLSVEDSIEGSRGVLQLATAAGIDNARATELAASALNAFGLAGSEATHVADLFANSANAAQGSIEDMGIALQQSAAVARQVGFTLEDTQALLTLLARNGLRGSDAGTSLRTAMLRLVNPTREANDLIRSLGLEIRDAQGNVRPEVFAEFGEATAELGPELRDAFAATIFGQDAIRAVAIASREGSAGLEEMREKLSRQGSAADLAAARMVGLTGAVSALTSNLETFGATIGGPIATRLTQFVNLLNLGVTSAEHLADALVLLRQKMEDLPVVGGFFGDLFSFAFQGPGDMFRNLIPPNLREDAHATSEEIREGLAPALREAGGSAESFRLSAERAAGGAGILVSELSGLADAAARTTLGGDPLFAQISAAQATLLAQLGQLQRAQAEGAEKATVEPIQEAIERSIALLESFGPRGAAALRDAGAQLTPFLGDQLRAALGEFTGEDLTRQTGLTQSLKDMVADLAQTDVGRAELRAIGSRLMDSLAEGVEDNQKAVAAARRNLREVIEQGQEAVREAVRSARSNLESLGTSLADQVGEIIDAMQFRVPTFQRRLIRIGLEVDLRGAQQQLQEAREAGLRGDELDPFIENVNDAGKTLTNFAKTGKSDIESLQKVLDELQERQQRRELRRGFRQAQEDLSDLRDSIAGVAQVAPGGSGTIARMLRDATEEVADRKAALEEFDLQDLIEGAKDIKEDYKEAAEEGIQEVIDKFEDGKISAKEFQRQLEEQLAPVLRNIGKADLGIRFTRAFQRNMQTLLKQAQALAGFLGIPGTEPGAKVVKPAETVAEQAQKRLDAAQRLQEAIDKNTLDTATNTKNTVRALAQIRLVLEKKPVTKANLKQVTSDIESARNATNVGNG